MSAAREMLFPPTGPRTRSLLTDLPRNAPPCLPPQNLLLAALPATDSAALAAALEMVTLEAGQLLSGPCVLANHVYFPIDALVSLVCLTEDGGSTEIALIGNEGLVGIGLFMGGSTAVSQATVQCAGRAYRLRASALRDEFNRSAPLRDLLLRYMQALLTQSSQTAVCNRHHSVEQQLCRWLLSAVDRLRSKELKMTQESIANALGVRRAGINEAAGKLQAEGALRYSRGRIAVLDRAGLERNACECYGVVKQEFARLFPPASAREAARGLAPVRLVEQSQRRI